MIDATHLKIRLMEEKDILEKELSRLGVHTSKDTSHWEATEAAPSNLGEDLGENKAEETEMADQIEDFEERTAETRNLEVRYRQVIDALTNMENGSYGICKTGFATHPIEPARLEANPAAITCMLHMQDKS